MRTLIVAKGDNMKEFEKMKKEIEESEGLDIIIDECSIVCYEEEYFNAVGSPKFVVMFGLKRDVLDGMDELKRMIAAHKKQEMKYAQRRKELGIVEVENVGN